MASPKQGGTGPDSLLRPDLCVIGGGSGGLAVAAGAAQMGARVVLVEGGRMGGDCLNRGCVPSKALIAAAARAHGMTAGAPFGVAPVAPDVDYGAAKDHVARVIAAIAPHDSVERFEGLGVTVIPEWGRFVSPRELQAGAHRIRARRFVIATGSVPVLPPIPGLDRVPCLTNETIFELRERPEHLLVIGGGPIGIELAQAHRRLGSRVTVIEARRVLGGEDPELTAILLDRLRAEGVGIIENAPALGVDMARGRITVRLAEGRRVDGTHLLVAAGRRPATAGLGLEAAGVREGPRGIVVNRGLRSSNRRIYAIGDVTGLSPFTHVAGYQAGLVIRSALLGLPVRMRSDHLPRAVYTDPELAHVGLTEEAARRRHGARLEVVRLPYARNDRARATGQEAGLVKLMAVRGRPVGVSIVGAQAGELIGLWSLAIANRLKLSAVAGMVAPYPTLAELNRHVAGQYYAPYLFDNPRIRWLVRLIQRF